MPKSANHILVVDDGDEDFDLLSHALRSCGITHELVRCRRAREALCLFHADVDRNAERPCIIFLDLNLPDIDGRELLSMLRSTDAGRATPILVLSTSNNPQDVRLCYAKGANGYLVKPLGLAELKNLACAFRDFWLHTVELPQ